MPVELIIAEGPFDFLSPRSQGHLSTPPNYALGWIPGPGFSFFSAFMAFMAFMGFFFMAAVAAAVAASARAHLIEEPRECVWPAVPRPAKVAALASTLRRVSGSTASRSVREQ